MADLGFEVVGVDVDPAKVATLQRGEAPFYEPGLEPLLRKHVEAGRLRFTTDLAQAADADVHFLCVGTPQSRRSVNGLATQRAAARLGVPYVYEMRGLEDLMKVSRDPAFDGSDRRRFLDTVEGASCLGAERVFVITEALKREMAARGVPEEKLVVLPNGVHTALFQPRDGTPSSRPRWGCAARP